MTLQQTKHAPAILRHFGGVASSEFFDIFADVLTRALCDFEDNQDTPENEIGDNITNAINDSLIYYADQWEIMKHYQTPEDASLSDAVESFYSDLLAVASEIIENQ